MRFRFPLGAALREDRRPAEAAVAYQAAADIFRKAGDQRRERAALAELARIRAVEPD